VTRGCRYVIDRRVFLSELQPQSSGKYEKRNVRGEVVVSDKTRYFIDRDGNVRLGDKQFILDKKSFESEIKSAGKCYKLGDGRKRETDVRFRTAIDMDR
jgi:hypothetical protein